MKWMYIGFGTLGAVTAVVFMLFRTFTYYSKVAEAIGRAEVEFNVLIVVGGSMGVMMIPVGVGVGLIVAVVINLMMVRLRLGPFSASDESIDGSSWVTRRDRVRNSTGNAAR